MRISPATMVKDSTSPIGRSRNPKVSEPGPTSVQTPLGSSSEAIPRADSRIRDLLIAYNAILQTVDALPFFVMVRSRHSRSKLLRGVYVYPRPRWLLRFLILRHLKRTLDALGRLYARRAALVESPTNDQAARSRVDEFLRSLPRTRPGLYVTALGTGILLLDQIFHGALVPPEDYRSLGGQQIQRLIAQFAAQANSTLVNLLSSTRGALLEPLVSRKHGFWAVVVGGSSNGSPSISDAVKAVGDYASRAGQILPKLALLGLQRDQSSLLQSVGAALTNPALWLSGILLLSLFLYVVLHLFLPSFRLKRLLFNLHPHVDEYRRSATWRWHLGVSTGLYGLENEVFNQLGVARPLEMPLDLAVCGFGTLVLLMLGLTATALLMGSVLRGTFPPTRGILPTSFQIMFSSARTATPGPLWIGRPAEAVLVTAPWALVLLGLPLFRLVSLFRTWRRRSSDRRLPSMPFQVAIGDGAALAKCQSPLRIGLLCLVPYLFCFSLAFEGLRFARGLATTPNGPSVPVGGLITPVMILAAGLFVTPAFASVWWYRVNRELRDLGRNRGLPLGRLPFASTMAFVVSYFGFPLPALVSVFRAGLRIRTAQKATYVSHPMMPAWVLVPGLVVSPLVFAYLQKQMNALWAMEGRFPPEAPSAPMMWERRGLTLVEEF
jgi:hypothetical protein